jgi:hypothetical protein
MARNVQVISFDDLQGQQSLPSNYAGFTWGGPINIAWENMVGGFLSFRTYSDSDDPKYTGPVVISHRKVFELIGLCIACTTTAGTNLVIVEGWRGKKKLHSKQFEVNRHFQFYVLFYEKIDTLNIYSPNDLDYIDNITVTL